MSHKLLLTLVLVLPASVKARDVAEVVDGTQKAVVLLSWKESPPTYKPNQDKDWRRLQTKPQAANQAYNFYRQLASQQAPMSVYANGILVSADGIIVAVGAPTLADDVKKIEVTLPNKKKYQAKRLVVDRRSGLCLLRIDADVELDFLKPEVADPRVGDQLVNVYRATDLNFVASVGILSAKNRSVGSQRLLQTDLRVGPGSSGSPIVSRDGQLVGIVIASVGASPQSFSGHTLAIPARHVEELIASIDSSRKTVVLEPAYLGVVLDDGNGGEVVVKQVMEGSGAADAGIKAHDVILSVAQNRVASAQEVVAAVRESKVDKEIAIEIQRGEKKYVLPVLLSKRSDTPNPRPPRVVQVEPGQIVPLTVPNQSSNVSSDQQKKLYEGWLQQYFSQQLAQQDQQARTLRVQRSALDKRVEELEKELQQLQGQINTLTITLKNLKQEEQSDGAER